MVGIYNSAVNATTSRNIFENKEEPKEVVKKVNKRGKQCKKKI